MSGKKIKLPDLKRLSVKDKAVLFFILCIIAELFVFNINAFHLVGKQYEKKHLHFTDAQTENFDISANRNIGSGSGYIEFKDLNMPVGTITIDAESSSKSSVNISIDVTDDTHCGHYYGGLAKAEVIKNNKSSRTIICNFFGNTHDLKFNFNADGDEIIRIRSIKLNEPVGLRFSLLRIFMLYAAIMLFYLVKYYLGQKQGEKRSFAAKEKLVTYCAWGVTAFALLFCLYLTNSGRYTNPNHSFSEDWKMTDGNQMTKELVDAFRKGTTVLNDEPNEALEALDNLYDWSQRDNIAYPWDHLYFEGKVYSYYGIAPVLLLFLPYNVLTGYYFPSSWAVFLFCAVGIVFLTKFYLLLIKKFFSDITAETVFWGLVILQLTTGIYLCPFNANFYEIAQASGFACLPTGAYLLLRSNVLGSGKINNKFLAASAAVLSLGVLCRPTLAVYCIAALFYIYVGFMTKLKGIKADKKAVKKTYISYFVSALLPFVCIGLVQMIYNYVRFKSVFDFGIQYSLTINDFTQTEFHTQLAAIGFYNYLLLFPGAKDVFPFYSNPGVLQFSPQGYYFVATSASVGLLWRALPIASYFKAKKAYDISKDADKKYYALLIFVSCLLCPFIIIFSIWESGYGARYIVDFGWQIVTGAYIIAFTLYRHSGSELRAFLNRLMRISSAAAFVFLIGDMYMWIVNSVNVDQRAALYSFTRLFEFWK